MPAIQEFATLTSKGQITLPKSIRQALGVHAGVKVAFELREDGQIVISRAQAEHADPAIGAFLNLLENDLKQGQHIQDLPQDLARAMLKHAKSNPNPHAEIEGEVAL